MSKPPLPTPVNIVKLANKGADYAAEFTPAVLPGFASKLANKEGSVSVNMQIYTEEQRRRRVDGRVQATVNAVCQRCLEPVSIELSSSFELAAVWSDDAAKALPGSLDPLLLDSEEIDLNAIIEEELLLAMPIVSYHDSVDCNQYLVVNRQQGEELDAQLVQQKPNPFAVLEALKQADGSDNCNHANNGKDGKK